MSAQVIAALRRRAAVLDEKAAFGPREPGDARMTGAFYAQLASEFRALADEAEEREPRPGPPFPGDAEPQAETELEP